MIPGVQFSLFDIQLILEYKPRVSCPCNRPDHYHYSDAARSQPSYSAIPPAFHTAPFTAPIPVSSAPDSNRQYSAGHAMLDYNNTPLGNLAPAYPGYQDIERNSSSSSASLSASNTQEQYPNPGAAYNTTRSAPEAYGYSAQDWDTSTLSENNHYNSPGLAPLVHSSQQSHYGHNYMYNVPVPNQSRSMTGWHSGAPPTMPTNTHQGNFSPTAGFSMGSRANGLLKKISGRGRQVLHMNADLNIRIGKREAVNVQGVQPRGKSHRHGIGHKL